MTKKDYIKIAQVLKDSKPVNPDTDSVAYHMHKQWNITCENMAYMLSLDNPLFNRQRFLAACSYND